jgi:hypothetical protein
MGVVRKLVRRSGLCPYSPPETATGHRRTDDDHDRADSGQLERVACLAGHASLADPLELLGYVIVAFFVAVWAGAVALWRFGGFDRRYGGDADDMKAGRTLA